MDQLTTRTKKTYFEKTQQPSVSPKVNSGLGDDDVSQQVQPVTNVPPGGAVDNGETLHV